MSDKYEIDIQAFAKALQSGGPQWKRWSADPTDQTDH